MTTSPRGEERWVAACIQSALPGVVVTQHDDGSVPGMYDLELSRDGVPFAACEVTAAADPEAIELWNLVNGGERWIEPYLAGGWHLTLAPNCRAKRLRAEAPALLRRLEADPTDWSARAALTGLQVVDAYRGGTKFPGSIYATIQRAHELTGGVVASTGDPLAEWFDAWVVDSSRNDNLAKLRRASHGERHLFVLLPGFASAPFVAADLLVRDDAPLPTVSPSMPAGLTHLWFMSTWSSGLIYHWSPDGWEQFPKVFEAIAP